jgi:hypothetical protein
MSAGRAHTNQGPARGHAHAQRQRQQQQSSGGGSISSSGRVRCVQQQRWQREGTCASSNNGGSTRSSHVAAVATAAASAAGVGGHTYARWQRQQGTHPCGYNCSSSNNTSYRGGRGHVREWKRGQGTKDVRRQRRQQEMQQQGCNCGSSSNISSGRARVREWERGQGTNKGWGAQTRVRRAQTMTQTMSATSTMETTDRLLQMQTRDIINIGK